MRELDRVIGYEGIKQELYRIIDIIRDPEKYKKLGVSAPKGILLSGVPGIGKTLMAKSFVKETGLKVFVIRKDRPDGAFVDLIRETFKEAEKAARSTLPQPADEWILTGSSFWTDFWGDMLTRLSEFNTEPERVWQLDFVSPDGQKETVYIDPVTCEPADGSRG